MRRRIGTIGLAVWLMTWGVAASAADLVVVKSEGLALHVGEVIQGDQPLRLDAGQSLSLIAPSGKIIRLSGPFEQPPLPDAAPQDPSAIGALKSMIAARAANTASLGITRATTTELPEPWVLDVGSSGNRCIVEGRRLVLWRPDGQASLPLTLLAKDGAWRAHALWPAGKQKLNAPAGLALADGDLLEVRFDNGSATLTAILIPAVLGTDPMRLAWLLEKGCDAQAAALANRLK